MNSGTALLKIEIPAVEPALHQHINILCRQFKENGKLPRTKTFYVKNKHGSGSLSVAQLFIAFVAPGENGPRQRTAASLRQPAADRWPAKPDRFNTVDPIPQMPRHTMREDVRKYCRTCKTVVSSLSCNSVVQITAGFCAA